MQTWFGAQLDQNILDSIYYAGQEDYFEVTLKLTQAMPTKNRPSF